MEKKAKDADIWKWRSFSLMYDTLVYQRAGGGRGSDPTQRRRKCIPLSECLRVDKLDTPDRRVFLLNTKSRVVILRAKNDRERDAWVLAIAKQAALVKEIELLTQAEEILHTLEYEKSSKVEAEFVKVTTSFVGCVSFNENCRDLFLAFAQEEWTREQSRRQKGDPEKNSTECPYTSFAEVTKFVHGVATGVEEYNETANKWIRNCYLKFRRHPYLRQRIENVAVYQ